MNSVGPDRRCRRALLRTRSRRVSGRPVGLACEELGARVLPTVSPWSVPYDVTPALVADTRHEILFVDSTVDNLEQLLSQLPEGTLYETFVIGPNQDGMQIISDVLARHTGIDAVHIVSHGSAGALQLGSARLDSGSIKCYEQQIFRWGQALADHGDLLFYGCNLAQTQDGQDLLTQIQQWTGADVAGSTDVTDASDWELEFQIGAVETATPFAASGWQGQLLTYTVVNANDAGAGSLRWAIDNANMNAGQDTIHFNIAGAGPHTIFVNSSWPAITDALIIDATTQPGYVAGAPTIIVDGSSAGSGKSGFTIQANDTFVAGIRIQGFSQDGIRVENADNLTLTANVIVSNGGSGVFIDQFSEGVVISQNSIFGNGRLGIDLQPAGAGDPANGVSANDFGDGDGGGNSVKNFPVLTSAATNSAGQIDIAGTYNSLALSRTYRLEFFASATADPSGFGEGQRYLGFLDITTDGSGNASFSVTLAATVLAGESISATSTDLTLNSTSELSAVVVAVGHAPVLDPSRSPALGAVNEDAGAPVGAVGTLVSQLVDFATPAGQVDNVVDVDGGALLGIAVTAADAGGSWWYSLNNGANWFALGAVADDNARLLAASAGVRVAFQPPPNFSGTLPSALTFRAWDRTTGNNGGFSDTTSNGGNTAFSSDTDVASLVVNAVNDAPTATITPASYAATEQVALTLHGTGLSIGDIDAGGSNVQATLSVGSGILNASAGTTGVVIVGSGTSSVTLTGTVAQINDLLAGNLGGTLSFLHSSDAPPASTVLTLAVNDLGNTGAGGALTASDTATINITATNDAPTATITPASYAATEQVALTLHGTGISIADPDAGSNNVQATVSVVSGTLNASAGTTGVGIVGSGTNSITLTGTLAQINNLLAGNLGGTLTYLINSNTPPASDTLTLAIDDLGNTGAGGALTASDSAAINITATNDAPTATITPASYAATEQVALTLHGTGLSIGDVDAGNNNVQATVSVGSGVLSASAGTTGVSVIGSGTSSVTLTGTVAQINDLLAGNLGGTLSFLHSNDAPPASTVLTLAVNDLGNTGAGGALTASDTATINIAATNDAPTATITPASYVATEQVALTLHGTGISIADPDAGGNNVQATVSVVSGTLNASAGTTGVGIVGSGTNSITLTGTLTQINNLLAGNLGGTLSYVINSNTPPASDTLTLVVDDLGNTGGGALTASDSAAINITATNDAPTATITPASYVATEQVALTLHGTGLSIGDVDAGNNNVQATVSVGSGVLNASAGTTGVVVAGSGTGSVTLTGTVAQINNLLAGNLGGTLSFLHSSDAPPASTVLTLAVNDLGNTGAGGALTASDTATINITAIDDAAVLTLPGPLSTQDDTPVAFNVSVSDVDDSTLQITLTVANGTLTLSQTAGLAFAIGDGTNDPTMTFTGSLADINDALTGLVYRSDLFFDGTETVQVDVFDGSQTTSGNVSIAVDASNLAPTLALPGPLAVSEDTPIAFTVSVGDPDAGGNPLEVTLSVTNGTLSLSQTAGLTFAVGDGTGDAVMTFTGSVADLNAALAGMTYQGNLNFNGSDALQVAVDDLGNTGVGGPLTASGAVAITVSAVNDAPTLSVPGAQSVAEDGSLAFPGNVLAVDDVDAGSLLVTIRTTNGRLTLGSTANLFFIIGDGVNDSTLVFTGAPADINAALDGLVYVPFADYFGPELLEIEIDDQGNTGAGGAQIVNGNVPIAVTPVSDAPVGQDDAYVLDEDGSLAVPTAGVLANDSDVDGDALQANLLAGPQHGTLQFNADGSFVYVPTPLFHGVDSFTYEVVDGQNATGPVTVVLTVNHVNHAPVPQDDSLALVSGATISISHADLLANDVDVDGDPLVLHIVQGTQFGILTVGPDGVLTYRPDNAFLGEDSFQYFLSDGTVDSAIVTVRLTVTPAPIVPPEGRPNGDNYGYVSPEGGDETDRDATASGDESDADDILDRIRGGGAFSEDVAPDPGAPTLVNAFVVSAELPPPPMPPINDNPPMRDVADYLRSGLTRAGQSLFPATVPTVRTLTERWRENSAALFRNLDEATQHLENANRQRNKTIAAVAGAVTTAATGYVFWNLRSLYLLASLMAARPIWRQFDPLAILDLWDKKGKKRRSDEKQLDRLFD